MMEHLSTLFYRLLMHSSICTLEEFLFIYFINRKKNKNKEKIRNDIKVTLRALRKAIFRSKQCPEKSGRWNKNL